MQNVETDPNAKLVLSCERLDRVLFSLIFFQNTVMGSERL
ncbi:hypothetical protein AAZX31_01G061800 [Glycine max]